jgi:hypothetical protein
MSFFLLTLSDFIEVPLLTLLELLCFSAWISLGTDHPRSDSRSVRVGSRQVAALRLEHPLLRGTLALCSPQADRLPVAQSLLPLSKLSRARRRNGATAAVI